MLGKANTGVQGSVQFLGGVRRGILKPTTFLDPVFKNHCLIVLRNFITQLSKGAPKLLCIRMFSYFSY